MFNTNTMFFTMFGKRKYPLQVLQKPYIQMHLPRPGTDAAELKQIDASEIKRRSKIIFEQINKIFEEVS